MSLLNLIILFLPAAILWLNKFPYNRMVVFQSKHYPLGKEENAIINLLVVNQWLSYFTIPCVVASLWRTYFTIVAGDNNIVN